MTSGGCGGRGGLDGCPACDSVFVQTSGGMLASPDGEHFAPSEWKYKELCWHLAKDIKIHQSTEPQTWDKKPNPYHNQWHWAEVGFGEIHFFDTYDEANSWLQIYKQQLKDQLGWPHCDLCGQMAGKDYVYFRCQPCDLHSKGADTPSFVG